MREERAQLTGPVSRAPGAGSEAAVPISPRGKDAHDTGLLPSVGMFW